MAQPPNSGIVEAHFLDCFPPICGVGSPGLRGRVIGSAGSGRRVCEVGSPGLRGQVACRVCGIASTGYSRVGFPGLWGR
eukprot:1195243-Prorocentrum_minimum.AAC.4